MTDTVPELDQALEALHSRTARTRRSAAKRLRRLKDPSAGPALLAALRREVHDPRTWETQYQMVMALAESGYQDALPYLRELAQQDFEATILYVALGDAKVRLGRSSENDPTPVLDMLETSNISLINGAFRAVAMLRLTLNPPAVEAIIDHVSRLGLNDGLRFWVAAAAAGWSVASVDRFLAACTISPREDVRTAAIASQQGRYRRWRIL
jgi:HEAT repeat protein